MVLIKAPTKHGFDRKFKPWRRGKSEKSNKRGSLKQQLRGVERLLQKVPDGENEKRKELQQKIHSLNEEIGEKQKSLQEKKNAEKAHGQRFLDRQRLTRQEKRVRKQKDASKRESELFKIALDQVYVAHHPNDVKYMPIFRKGQRVVDTSRQLYRRAVTRRRILKNLTKEDRNKCPWICNEQYDRLPSEGWTIQDEERMFGGSITRQGMKEVKTKLQSTKEDDRFSLAPKHEAVLEMADKVDAELDEKEEADDDDDQRDSSNDSDMEDEQSKQVKQRTSPTSQIARADRPKDDSASEDSSSDSDDDNDELGPVNCMSSAKNDLRNDRPPDSSGSIDSDNSSDEEQEKSEHKGESLNPNGNRPSSSDGSSSDSSDEGDESDADNPEKPGRQFGDTKEATSQNNEEVDDFLMDATGEEDKNVFSMTLKRLPAVSEARGDKSQGWETQRQRPGQFKKRRVRR